MKKFIFILSLFSTLTFADSKLIFVHTEQPTITARLQEFIDSENLTLIKNYEKLNILLLRAPSDQNIRKIKRQQLFSRWPIDNIENVGLVEATGIKPNDPEYVNQNHYLKYPLENLWDLSTGSERVIVAIPDSGMDISHADLATQTWTNIREIPDNLIDDDENGYIDDIHGWDYVGQRPKIIDYNFHGSHVAGIIGARGNNGHSIAGINWNIQIMPLAFLNEQGQGTTDQALDAIIYAVDNGAKIINTSWRTTESEIALEKAVQYALSKGVLVVAAAGNDTLDVDKNISWPAGIKSQNIISVAASTGPGVIANFSNFGRFSVDLAAPGKDILSLMPGDKTVTASGTSMAAPFITGLAAWVLSVKPDLNWIDLRNIILSATDKKETYIKLFSTEGEISTDKLLEIMQSKIPKVIPSQIRVNVGDTFTWSLFPKPQTNGSFLVEDPKIASIDNEGNLKGLKEGSTRVVYKTKSNTYKSDIIQIGNGIAAGPSCKETKQTANNQALFGFSIPLFFGWIAIRLQRKKKIKSS